MDWKDYLDNTNAALAKLRGVQPAAAEGFSGLHHAGMAAGSMSVREKELVALGIGISKQCLDCIGFHVRAAAKAGATREDIAETVSVAVVMGGGPAFMYGSKALDAYDQLVGTDG